jgi:hypothetical protein
MNYCHAKRKKMLAAKMKRVHHVKMALVPKHGIQEGSREAQRTSQRSSKAQQN